MKRSGGAAIAGRGWASGWPGREVYRAVRLSEYGAAGLPGQRLPAEATGRGYRGLPRTPVGSSEAALVLVCHWDPSRDLPRREQTRTRRAASRGPHRLCRVALRRVAPRLAAPRNDAVPCCQGGRRGGAAVHRAAKLRGTLRPCRVASHRVPLSVVIEDVPRRIVMCVC